MTTGEITAALVLDGVRAMSAAQRDELRALLDLDPPGDTPRPDGWMGTREAAVYLGLSMYALRRLMADRAVPFEQSVPGGKGWFSRGDLDLWRRGRGVDAPRRSA